ncbi:MAG: beta-galactosidase [Capsulimonadaceae bacterium]|nr:beta-galactosidase [Capsulimonadaceae bacterium]
MKSFPITAFLAALCIVFTSMTALAAPDNIAVAPSFEEGIQGWSGYPSFPIERSTEFAHTGRYSIKFPQGSDSRAKSIAGMETIPYSVEPGGRYRCSIFARADAAAGNPARVNLFVATVVFEYSKPSTSVAIPPDGQWHEVSMEFALPPFVDLLSVGLQTSGVVWVDDFSIVQTAPPPVAPLSAAIDAPVYVSRTSPVEIAETLRNSQAEAVTVSLSPSAWLPDANSPAALPARGYGKLLKQWPAEQIVVPAHGAATRKLSLNVASLPDTGIKIQVVATAAAGERLCSAEREVFLCERPDWKTWYSIGAQCYTSNRFDGSWVRSLHDLGGDSVRECLPLPMSYRNAVPGLWTDYPLKDRLGYYARWGIKWLSAYHVIVNNAPAWLAEDPANRRMRFDGTIVDKPAMCYFAPKARAAMMRDAELGGSAMSKCPDVFGVQVDNEINAFDCYCPDAQASFRQYVKGEFGTIAAVNKAWGTSYASFDEVRVPAPLFTSYFDDATAQLDAPQPEKRIAARDYIWLNWREQSFISFYRDWTAHFKKTADGLPVTDNFSLYVSTLPRFFYAAPVDLFQFAEFFDVGGVDTGPSFGHDAQYIAYQFDWVNSAWGDRPVWVPEIYYDWEKADPHAVGFDLFYGMGRKVQHTNLFTWPVLADKWGGSYSDNLTKDRAYMFDNVKADIASARKFNSEVPVSSLHYVAPPVGIYWSSSVHNFALALGQQDWLAGTDPLYDLDKIFTDLHYPVQFVDSRRLAKSPAAGPRALFVGGMHSLSAAEWASLLAYARAGGLLVLTGATGDYDERLTPYASSPCGRGAEVGISLGHWRSASTELYSDCASRLVKLGKNRKLRGFGVYDDIRISSEWQTLLHFADGKPGIVTRPFGNGRIVWSLTDIANPYANYQTSNTLFLVEGLLEASGIGRPVRVLNASTGDGAPRVTVSVKRRTDRETFLFANNFGPEGDYRFLVNFPLHALAITEMISGRKVAWTAERGCAAFTAHMASGSYSVYRVQSEAVDLTRLAVHSVLDAPASVAGSQSRGVHRPAPTVCTLVEAKATSGAPLYWLTSPFARAALTLDKGARLAYLSSATDDANDIVPPLGVFPPDGIAAGADGGIKSVLDGAGAGYPGLTMQLPFTVTGKEQSDEQASVSAECRLSKENLLLDQTVSVSRTDPALTYRVIQRPITGMRKLRLLLHSNLMLGGEVKREIRFVAGNDRECVSLPYQLGLQESRPVAMPVKWSGVVDPVDRNALLCVYRKGYTRVTFWNGMRDYNIEPSSDFADVNSAAGQAGEASIYVCSGTRKLNFVAGDIAGYFDSWPEAGGQSVSIVMCGLSALPRRLDLVVAGVKNGVQSELGALSLDVQPVTGVEKNLSLGGAGGGYDSYMLCVRKGADLTVLKEVRGDAPSDEAKSSISAADSGTQDKTIAAWGGDEAKSLTAPVRVAPQPGWDLASGTVRVRFKTSAARDVVHNGVDLVNGYHGEVSYHTNRKSRLWLNIHGLAVWSPTSPMIFFALYDKEGRQIRMTANATLRDETWYELAAVWDVKTKSVGLYLDGFPLKLGESVIPPDWNGAESIEAIDIGGKDTAIGAGSILSVPARVKSDE